MSKLAGEHLKKRARAAKGDAYHLVCQSRMAMPGWLVVLPPNLVLFVHICHPGHELSEAQIKEQRHLTNIGMLVFNCAGIPGVDILMDHFTSNAGAPP